MDVRRLDAGDRQDRGFRPGPDHVDRRRAAEVAAFHDDVTGACLGQLPGRRDHVLDGTELPADEHGGLPQVGRDHERVRKEPLHVGPLGLAVEQTVPRRRDHHRVDDQVGEVTTAGPGRDGGDGGLGCQHPGLDGRGSKVGHDRADLGVHVLGRDDMHVLHAHR